MPEPTHIEGVESEYPVLDDRNPASVVGVPWNEGGYADPEGVSESLKDSRLVQSSPEPEHKPMHSEATFASSTVRPPSAVPCCAVCGAAITSGYHECVPPLTQTSVLPRGGIRLTPWGTWEWRPW